MTIRSRLAILPALALAACAPARSANQPAPLDAAALETYPDARGMPADVQHFIVQWNDCAHWLGEPPFDADRARQIERAVAEICPGVDARARQLRERHAGNAAVLARLADYEPLGQ
jgi:hypothetical protein